MKIISLTSIEFDNFSKNHVLSSFFQTSKYALLMGEHGYDFEYIGYIDEEDNIIAGSLILLKKIKGKILYGYAPNGFLIDYTDEYLIKDFTKAIKDYYYQKNVAFIKLNPLIAIGKIDNKTKEITYNENRKIRDILANAKYLKLKNNLYFESSLPRFNGLVDLITTTPNEYTKNTRNKINKAIKRGLVFEKGKDKQLETFLKLMPKEYNKDDYYFRDLYTIFSKDNSIDLFLVKIDYEDYLINARIEYDREIEKNTSYNEKLINEATEENINIKMNSDKIILSYKNDILEGTKGLKENKEVYIAGALVIKHNNVVTIYSSWYDKKYLKFNANYFIHHKLIEYYKDDYKFFDLNGMTGDFTHRNPYYGLNRFKFGFNPNVYEFIGEYDLIVDHNDYVYLQENNLLAKEFNKKEN
ncbi:MAG: peptidoglycan bridge formation glycyltransferase FemA/FemB family protein [Bacilli bacterium]|nr:peptidoglycan bridge formation glycyltransferase FemA/FemB family protein [Bacilli bacterium]